MADLNANNIQEENPVVVPENTGDTTSIDHILDSTASTADIEKGLARESQRKADRAKEIETELPSAIEKDKEDRKGFLSFQKTRPSREKELREELASLGVTEDIETVRGLVGEVGALREQLNKIDEAKALAIEGLAGQGRGIPLSIIRGQQAKTERQYNIRRAAVAAELGAKAATAEALRGNAEFAAKLAQDTVDAIVFDYQQKVNDYEDLFEYNQDIIDGLTTEQKGILEQQRDDAKDELERRREESTIVSGMMIDNPNAGVLPTDSLAIASQKVAKAGGSLEARREARLGGAAPSIAPLNVISNITSLISDEEVRVDLIEDVLDYFDLAQNKESPTDQELGNIFISLRNSYSEDEVSSDSLRAILGIEKGEGVATIEESASDFLGGIDVFTPNQFTPVPPVSRLEKLKEKQRKRKEERGETSENQDSITNFIGKFFNR
jgi:hypothetical protein|tara:strand:- start:14341 stop:15660 length:1320 start_codon:yes stop_codon:yes gene_type:complete